MQNQRHLFSFPKDVTYLNIASQSPAFSTIEKAGIEAILQKSNPHTITIPHYFEPVNQLKQLFARLIHAENYQRVVTIPSVSYGMATVANNIRLNPNDEILLVDEQFPSNYYAWKKLADTYKATLKTVKKPNTKNACGQQWNQDILAAINENTALVAMGNIHWTNGTLFDLKAIRAKTSQHNALLVIDGSQSVGALPFSVQEIQPDALICAGYKWLFGPYGCAYAYYGPYFDQGTPIEENWSNRLDSEDFSKLTNYQSEYKPFANRYTVGESGSFIYIQMQIAALKQVLEWTPEAIQEYCKEISSEAVKILQEAGCTIESETDRTHHLFGVELPKQMNLEVLKTKLKESKIYVSFRGSYIRISCHVFNTKEDFKKLTEVILALL